MMSVWKKIWYAMIILGCVFACGGCGKETPLSFSTSEEVVSVEDEEITPSEEQKNEVQTEKKQENPNEQNEQKEEQSKGPLAVYICGAVTNPGVYEVPQGSRVYQVIEKAGGLREDAADDCVNQADVVTDAQMIKIYTKEEMAAGNQQALQDMAKGEELAESAAGEETSGLVNINTAAKEELMTLSGIGEAKADSIIKYRETNGAFGKIEDIKNITGIKDGVFEKIKDSITV